MPPTIVVVIPIGPGRTGKVALRSMLSTIGISQIIIVIDGGKPDAIVEMVRARVSTTIIESAGKGATAARNSGAAMANSGDYVWFLDDDDAALPNAIDIITKAILDTPDADVWAFSARRKSGTTIWNIYKKKTGQIDRKMISRRNVLGGCSSVVMRRDTFIAAGGFDPRFVSMQDWDLYLRLARNSPIQYSTDTLVTYDDTGTDRISTNANKKYTGLVQLLDKHRLYFDSRTIAFHETRICYYDCVLGNQKWSTLLHTSDKPAGLYYLLSHFIAKTLAKKTISTPA